MTTAATTGAVLYHNPGAGDGDHAADDLHRLLEHHGLGPVDYRTWSEERADEVATGSGPIVVAGGDGTVGAVLLASVGTGRPVGILPVGTANNLARSLGLPVGDLGAAAQVVVAGEVEHVDLPRAEVSSGTERFVEAAALGVFPQLVQAAARRSAAWSLERARRELVQLLSSAPAWSATVEIDGSRVDLDLLGVHVMNLDRVGPNVVLAPGADPADGLADVVVIPAELREDVVRDATGVASDVSDRVLALPRTKGSTIVVRGPSDVAVTLDDRVVSSSGELRVSYQAGAQASVVVPGGDPRRSTAGPSVG